MGSDTNTTMLLIHRFVLHASDIAKDALSKMKSATIAGPHSSYATPKDMTSETAATYIAELEAQLAAKTASMAGTKTHHYTAELEAKTRALALKAADKTATTKTKAQEAAATQVGSRTKAYIAELEAKLVAKTAGATKVGTKTRNYIAELEGKLAAKTAVAATKVSTKTRNYIAELEDKNKALESTLVNKEKRLAMAEIHAAEAIQLAAQVSRAHF